MRYIKCDSEKCMKNFDKCPSDKTYFINCENGCIIETNAGEELPLTCVVFKRSDYVNWRFLGALELESNLTNEYKRDFYECKRCENNCIIRGRYDIYICPFSGDIINPEKEEIQVYFRREDGDNYYLDCIMFVYEDIILEYDDLDNKLKNVLEKLSNKKNDKLYDWEVRNLIRDYYKGRNIEFYYEVKFV